MAKEINKVKEILEKKQIAIFAYIFGSRARGIVNEKSDCDVAIYFYKDPRRLQGWTVFQLEAEISREIEVETQITTLNGLDAPVFAFQIISEGIILIDKDQTKRILYEVSVIRRYHDWHYFLKRHKRAYNV